MSNLDNQRKLYPYCWFLERQDSPESKWEIVSRDNDEDVMRTRYQYSDEQLKPGQGVRLISPDGTIPVQRQLDKQPDAGIVKK